MTYSRGALRDLVYLNLAISILKVSIDEVDLIADDPDIVMTKGISYRNEVKLKRRFSKLIGQGKIVIAEASKLHAKTLRAQMHTLYNKFVQLTSAGTTINLENLAIFLIGNRFLWERDKPLDPIFSFITQKSLDELSDLLNANVDLKEGEMYELSLELARGL